MSYYKGIILAGGKGTRLYPVTLGVSKQLLPIYDKPMIYYPISVLMLAGIQEILIISTPDDIINYRRLLNDGSDFGLKFSYAIQKKPKGIGQTFLIGEKFIAKDNVALILGDNLFYGSGFQDILKKIIKRKNFSTLFGVRVNDPERYGVAKINNFGFLKSIEEKPIKPKSKPSLVIHFAGLKSVYESIVNPILYYDVNVNGTMNLLKAMDLIGCKEIIFSSSATVYGVPEYFPIDENHKCDPINTYGRTKYFIEHIIKDWSKNTNEKKAIILRYFNPAGAHETGFIGENPKGIPNNLFPFITHVISGKQKELNVYGNDYNTPDGTGIRDYIHVCDLARGHVLSIDQLKKINNYEIINLGSGRGFSVLEVINEFQNQLDQKLDYKILGRRAGDLDKLLAKSEKAKNMLNWDTKFNLKDIIRDSLAWTKKYPLGY